MNARRDRARVVGSCSCDDGRAHDGFSFHILFILEVSCVDKHGDAFPTHCVHFVAALCRQSNAGVRHGGEAVQFTTTAYWFIATAATFDHEMQHPYLIATPRIPPTYYSDHFRSALPSLNNSTKSCTTCVQKKTGTATQTPLHKRYLVAVPQTVNAGRTPPSLSTQLNSKLLARFCSNFHFL